MGCSPALSPCHRSPENRGWVCNHLPAHPAGLAGIANQLGAGSVPGSGSSGTSPDGTARSERPSPEMMSEDAKFALGF